MDNFDKVQIHYLERDLARVTAERDALGIQLAALRERLRLAMAVVEAARYGHPSLAVRTALAALDTVPGDELPHGALASSGRLDALAGRPTCDDTGRWRPIDATKEKP
jgi:hypothetical protein